MAHGLNCPTVKLRAVGNFLSDCCANPQHSKTKKRCGPSLVHIETSRTGFARDSRHSATRARKRLKRLQETSNQTALEIAESCGLPYCIKPWVALGFLAMV